MNRSLNQILMLVLVLLVPLMSFAHDVEIDEIFYNLDNEKKEATVTYKGCCSDNEDYTRFVVIPSSVQYNGVRYTVTAIGDGGDVLRMVKVGRQPAGGLPFRHQCDKHDDRPVHPEWSDVRYYNAGLLLAAGSGHAAECDRF